MLSGFLNVPRASDDGLQDEIPRHRTLETHVHPRVDERLDEQKHIGGAAGAESRNHVDVPLVFYVHLFSERCQYSPDRRLVFL